MVCRKKEPLLWAEILFGLFVCFFNHTDLKTVSNRFIFSIVLIAITMNKTLSERLSRIHSVLSGRKSEESSITRYFGTIKTTEMAIDLQ